ATSPAQCAAARASAPNVPRACAGATRSVSLRRRPPPERSRRLMLAIADFGSSQVAFVCSLPLPGSWCALVEPMASGQGVRASLVHDGSEPESWGFLHAEASDVGI